MLDFTVTHYMPMCKENVVFKCFITDLNIPGSPQLAGYQEKIKLGLI